MYENSAELAENKLLVLYVIKSLKQPISNTQLTEIILENNFINYFTLQQYISELEYSNFVKYIEKNEKKLISITDNYISATIENIKKELTIYSDYTIDNNDSYIVNLRAFEDESLLIDLKVSVPSKKQANALCSKWKDDPSTIYTKIIQSLFDDND